MLFYLLIYCNINTKSASQPNNQTNNHTTTHYLFTQSSNPGLRFWKLFNKDLFPDGLIEDLLTINAANLFLKNIQRRNECLVFVVVLVVTNISQMKIYPNTSKWVVFHLPSLQALDIWAQTCLLSCLLPPCCRTSPPSRIFRSGRSKKFQTYRHDGQPINFVVLFFFSFCLPQNYAFISWVRLQDQCILNYSWDII